VAGSSEPTADPPALRGAAGSPVRERRRRGVDPDLLRRWREAENLLFAYGMAEPEFYRVVVEVVRCLAEGLRDLVTVEDLEAAYDERGMDWAEARVIAAGFEGGEEVDLEAALAAAFNFRLRDLGGEEAAHDTAGRMAAARAAGETWAVTVDGHTGFAGRRTYRRVEIHVRSGVALFGYSHRDWVDQRDAWWLEVLAVDPATGAPSRGSRPLEEPRSFPDRQSWEQAFEETRVRHGEPSRPHAPSDGSANGGPSDPRPSAAYGA
jgi:hypothetical protein